MQKTIKLKIIKPKDIDWEQLGLWLRDLQKQSREIANKLIIEYWTEYQQTGKNGIQTRYLYPKLTSEYPNIPASTVNQIERYVKNKWKTRRKDIVKGESSLISFKNNFPILIHNASYAIKKENRYINNRCSVIFAFWG